MWEQDRSGGMKLEQKCGTRIEGVAGMVIWCGNDAQKQANGKW